MPFDLRDFVAQPEASKLVNLKKIDWLSLAHWYKVEVSVSEKKIAIQNRVVVYLIDAGLITDEGFLHLKTNSDNESSSSDADSDTVEKEKEVRPKISRVKEVSMPVTTGMSKE